MSKGTRGQYQMTKASKQMSNRTLLRLARPYLTMSTHFPPPPRLLRQRTPRLCGIIPPHVNIAQAKAMDDRSSSNLMLLLEMENGDLDYLALDGEDGSLGEAFG